MLARTFSEMEAAYKHLEEMKKALEDVWVDLKTFDVCTILLQAQEKLRMVSQLFSSFHQNVGNIKRSANVFRYNLRRYLRTPKFLLGHGCFGKYVSEKIFKFIP